MRNRWFFTAITTAFFVGCASGPDVHVDNDPTADLKAYATFGFFPQQGRAYSTLVDEHVKRATRTELERRGYRYDERAPDLRVAYALKIDDRQQLRSSPALGPGPFFRSFNAYEIDTVEYKAGTLRIDLVDASRSALVWQGVAEGRVGQKALENPASAIGAIVAEMFADFGAAAR